jgi:hypothetical protein
MTSRDPHLPTGGSALPTEEIKAQLERILSNPEFVRSPRITQLLRFVVEETLAGRAKYLKAYTIAVKVFGRDEAFDAQSDSLVRVQGVRLRRWIRDPSAGS